MRFDLDDPQAWAAAILREVAMDGDEAPDPRRVAKRLSVTIVSSPARSILGGYGQMGRLGDGWVIRRAAGLPLPVLLFTIGHELGHIAIRRYGVRVADEEPWCNVFAGALLLPRDPLRHAWVRGGDLGDVIERWPNVSPTCAALRLGETRLAETMVIQGRAMRYVRMEAEPSQDLIALGVEAARAGRAARPGLAKAWKMPEVPRRAAVVLEEVS